jgi:hypothetical protein
MTKIISRYVAFPMKINRNEGGSHLSDNNYLATITIYLINETQIEAKASVKINTIILYYALHPNNLTYVSKPIYILVN